MIGATRKPGASGRLHASWCAGLVLAAGTLLLPVAGDAADLRLLRASRAATSVSALTPATPSGDTLRLRVEAGGLSHDLRLAPKTTLGTLAGRLRGRATAYQGHIADRGGSWAALTRIGERWTGIWFDGATYYGIDTAGELARRGDFATDAPPTALLAFRLADAVWLDASFEGDTLPAVRTAEDFVERVGAELGAPGVALASLPTRRLPVALVGDSDLVQQDGSQTEANMLAQLNVVDGIFASQVGVRVQSASVTLLDAAADPLAGPTDAQTLLEKLRDYRSATPLQRAAGLTHLMTGRNLDGRTVGIAYMSALCSTVYSASLSQATMSVSFAALVAAHEIGHVFGAPHDAETGSACEATPSSYLMAPQLNGSQTLSDCSLNQIAAVVATASCLVPADAADATIDPPPEARLALDRATDVTITVRSLGNIAVNGTNLRVTLPLALTLIDASGPTAVCGTNANVVNCALGSIAPADTATVTLRLLATTAGTTTAALRVTSTNDVQPNNNLGSLVLRADQGTDMATTATADPATLAPGGTTTATFTLQNRGPADVTDARLAISVPASVTVTGRTVEGTACADVTGGLACGPTALVAGASARVVLTLQATLAGTPELVATASSSRPELDAASDGARVTLTVQSPPPPPPTGGGTAGSGGGGGGAVPPGALALLAGLLLARRRRAARAH